MEKSPHISDYIEKLHIDIQKLEEEKRNINTEPLITNPALIEWDKKAKKIMRRYRQWQSFWKEKINFLLYAGFILFLAGYKLYRPLIDTGAILMVIYFIIVFTGIIIDRLKLLDILLWHMEPHTSRITDEKRKTSNLMKIKQIETNIDKKREKIRQFRCLAEK